MKTIALFALVLVPVAALADDLEPVVGWRLTHVSGAVVELWSDEETWQADPELPDYGHSFRRVRVVGSDGSELLNEVLPIDRAPDFAYRLSVDGGDAPFVVIEGTSLFYLLDLSDPDQPQLAGPIRPLSQPEIIGVDAVSGMIFNLWVSEDGLSIGGAVVNGGCFVLDVSDPLSPVRSDYTEDWNISFGGCDQL